MAHEKIVTAFKQLQQAQLAKEKLISEGIAETHIDIISNDRLRVEDKEIRHPSFWQRLFGDDVDDDYATEYNRAIQSGGVLLTVSVPKDDAARIETLLNQYSADYSPYGTGEAGVQKREFLGETNDVSGSPLTTGLVTDADVTAGATPKTVTGDALGSEKSEALKLAQEQVEIGKREVSDGTVRLRRYTVKDDVAEDVSLSEHHANVVRNAIDEPVYLNDVDWSEKTITTEESHEVPIVNKTARIKEEVNINNDVGRHVETVRDTVRRQEVDVEKKGVKPFDKN